MWTICAWMQTKGSKMICFFIHATMEATNSFGLRLGEMTERKEPPISTLEETWDEDDEIHAWITTAAAAQGGLPTVAIMGITKDSNFGNRLHHPRLGRHLRQHLCLHLCQHPCRQLSRRLLQRLSQHRSQRQSLKKKLHPLQNHAHGT